MAGGISGSVVNREGIYKCIHTLICIFKGCSSNKIHLQGRLRYTQYVFRNNRCRPMYIDHDKVKVKRGDIDMFIKLLKIVLLSYGLLKTQWKQDTML